MIIFKCILYLFLSGKNYNKVKNEIQCDTRCITLDVRHLNLEKQMNVEKQNVYDVTLKFMTKT